MILSHKTMVAMHTNPPLGNSKPSNFGKPKWTVHVTFIECVMMDSDLPGAYQSISFAAANESFIISRSTSFSYRLNI